MSDDVESPLEDQIRECFGRVVYSHKTHERMADLCIAKFDRYKTLQIALLGLTSTGAVGVVFSDKAWIEYGTVVLSFLTFFVSTYLKTFDMGTVVQRHRDAASKLWNVRECYLSLLTDLPILSRNTAIERRDELQASLAAIYEAAPQTNGRAYMEAQDRLKNKEDLTFSPEEIDHFLPLSLKRAGARRAAPVEAISNPF